MSVKFFLQKGLSNMRKYSVRTFELIQHMVFHKRGQGLIYLIYAFSAEFIVLSLFSTVHLLYDPQIIAHEQIYPVHEL